MKNFYDILGVLKSASKGEIQKAFRNLAKKYHPDLNPNNKAIEIKFKKINEAYEILKDEEKRKEYNKKLFGGTAEKAEKFQKTTKQTKTKFDFSSIDDSFENFFGFEAKTGNITNENKLKNKNPLDTSDLFEKFMGFKK